MTKVAPNQTASCLYHARLYTHDDREGDHRYEHDKGCQLPLVPSNDLEFRFNECAQLQWWHDLARRLYSVLSWSCLL